jgi:hypothetical protein
MQNCIITKVYKSNKGKDDKAFISKNGKPYWKVAIKTDRTGEDWYSTIAFKEDEPVMKLAEGDEKTLILDTNGEYKNFRIPTKLDYMEARIVKIEQWIKAKVDSDAKRNGGITGITSAGTPVPFHEPVKEISTDDIPFD